MTETHTERNKGGTDGDENKEGGTAGDQDEARDRAGGCDGDSGEYGERESR